jgi:hypothetical protein
MIDAKALSTDLARQVRALEADLHGATDVWEGVGDALRSEYERKRTGYLTGATWEVWRDQRLTQTAVAWVLATVFVRYCEDNGLVGPSPTLLGGLAATDEERSHYFSTHPTATELDWLLSGFDRFASTPIGARLFDPEHHPRYLLPISADAAGALVAFWSRRDEDGRLIHEFTDPNLGTRFLVDLYENLSESERGEYALLHTPEFVVDLILDLTFEPAAEEFGYDTIRIIDPACGSGQFVLATLRRLLHQWAEHRPDLPVEQRVRRALDAVHGVDLNPSAVAITRFRLLLTAWQAVDATNRDAASDADWPVSISLGDSLLPGQESPQAGGFHVVVGNPPYLTVKDPVLSGRYRERYDACVGIFALAVPFAQRFYELARPADDESQGAGYVGMLTSNSFMKREFGRRLATDFFATRVSLTHILDTSGAFIPGHGTPTAVVIGRNHRPVDEEPVLVVAGDRGEPSRPSDPRQGKVWHSILRNLTRAGLADRWTRSFYLSRKRLRAFPWQLTSGAAAEVLDRMSGPRTLDDAVQRIGYMAITGSDDVFAAPPDVFRRLGPGVDAALVGVVTGSDLRDWTVRVERRSIFPRREDGQVHDILQYSGVRRRLWPYRTLLGNRSHFSTESFFDSRRPWYDWHQVVERKQSSNRLITFPWVASHNHFLLLRGDVVPLQSAPVVELPPAATQWTQVFLVGLLNSSAVCFWLKQHSNSKGLGVHRDGSGEAWQEFYEFTSSQLRDLPLPADFNTWQAETLDGLAQERAACTPEAVSAAGTPSIKRLSAARSRWEAIGREMIAIQEELDWEIYSRYGLLPTRGLIAPVDSIPPLNLGERAFEIVLARRCAAGEEDTTWFTRHGSVPVTEVPEHWPAPYREVVLRRIETIERQDGVAVLERPEHKRRWAAPTWESMQAAALRGWLLDRCEAADLWFEDRDGARRPRPLTVGHLAELLWYDHHTVAVAALYAPGMNPVDVVADLIADEHVPYLAAMRYTPSGLAKRSTWEAAWSAQRAEDAALTDQERLAIRKGIPAPLKYVASDFVRASFWRHRGKFDVPKERFISYPPGKSIIRDQLLIGWAGWDHRERAQVLADLVTAALEEGVGEEGRVVPLLAGLYELLPWLVQWSDRPESVREVASGLSFEEFASRSLKRIGTDVDAVIKWRPPPPRRGRPRKI